MAREVAKEYGVDPRAAALLDIFSCVVQGLIPYGVQLYWPAQLQSFRQLNSSAAFTTVGYWQFLPSLRLHSVFHD
jgi:Na+/H+ antiporter NhaC